MIRKFGFGALLLVVTLGVVGCNPQEEAPVEKISETVVEDAIPKGRIYVCADGSTTYSGSGSNPSPCPEGVALDYVIYNVTIPVGEKIRDDSSDDEIADREYFEVDGKISAAARCTCANGTVIVTVSTDAGKKSCSDLCAQAAELIKKLGGKTPMEVEKEKDE